MVWTLCLSTALLPIVLAAPTGNATATATNLLPVPSYATQSTAAFATATAKALASSLPGYTYNLTEEVRSPSPALHDAR
ncbi:hypothetical protein NBRC10512_005557 [Rhodotorula toruloides]